MNPFELLDIIKLPEIEPNSAIIFYSICFVIGLICLGRPAGRR